MKSNVDEYMKLPYSTIVLPDVTTEGEPCYVAYNPELEGCMSHGDTTEEALYNLSEARKLFVSTLIAEGLEVPRPQGAQVNWEVISPKSEEPEKVAVIFFDEHNPKEAVVVAVYT